MGFREQTVLDAGPGGGGDHCTGHGFFSVRDSFVHVGREERRWFGPVGRVEPDYLSVLIFRGSASRGSSSES